LPSSFGAFCALALPANPAAPKVRARAAMAQVKVEERNERLGMISNSSPNGAVRTIRPGIRA
jgi:hypothetical protein